MSPPTGSPLSSAMRSAAARAARRRGERSHTAPLHHGWSRSAGAMRVVLPAPGGATTTRLGLSVNAARISGRTASIGSGWRAAAIASSIGAGDREGDSFGQRRLRLARAEAADRVDRALAIVTRPREGVRDGIMLQEQRLRLQKVSVRGAMADDCLLPEFAFLRAPPGIGKDDGQRHLPVAKVI